MDSATTAAGSVDAAALVQRAVALLVGKVECSKDPSLTSQEQKQSHLEELMRCRPADIVHLFCSKVWKMDTATLRRGMLGTFNWMCHALAQEHGLHVPLTPKMRVHEGKDRELLDWLEVAPCNEEVSKGNEATLAKLLQDRSLGNEAQEVADRIPLKSKSKPAVSAASTEKAKEESISALDASGTVQPLSKLSPPRDVPNSNLQQSEIATKDTAKGALASAPTSGDNAVGERGVLVDGVIGNRKDKDEAVSTAPGTKDGWDQVDSKKRWEFRGVLEGDSKVPSMTLFKEVFDKDEKRLFRAGCYVSVTHGKSRPHGGLVIAVGRGQRQRAMLTIFRYDSLRKPFECPYITEVTLLDGLEEDEEKLLNLRQQWIESLIQPTADIVAAPTMPRDNSDVTHMNILPDKHRRSRKTTRAGDEEPPNVANKSISGRGGNRARDRGGTKKRVHLSSPLLSVDSVEEEAEVGEESDEPKSSKKRKAARSASRNREKEGNRVPAQDVLPQMPIAAQLLVQGNRSRGIIDTLSSALLRAAEGDAAIRALESIGKNV